MASFNLLSLPIVSLRDVFTYMNTVDLFELSICSKSAFETIQKHGVLAEYMEFSPRALKVAFKNGTCLFWNFNSSSDSENNVSVGGIVYRRWHKRSASNIGCVPNNFNEDILAAFNYCRSLFRIKKFHMEIFNITGPFIDNLMVHLPRECQVLQFSDADVTPEQSNRIFDHFIVDKKVKIVKGDVMPHVMLERVDELHLGSTANFCMFDLARLQARDLWFKAEDSVVVNHLLRRWRDSVCWQNLMKLQVTADYRQFWDSLLKEINFSVAVAQPPLPRKAFRMFVRSSDQAVACAGIANNILQMCFVSVAMMQDSEQLFKNYH